MPKLPSHFSRSTSPQLPTGSGSPIQGGSRHFQLGGGCHAHCMGNWVIVPRSTGTRPLACLCLLYKMDYGFQAPGERISVSGRLGGLWPWRTLLDFAVSGSGQNQALRVPPLHPDKNDGSPAGSHLSSGGTVMVPCVSPGMSLLSGARGRRRVCPPTPPPPPPFHSHFVYGTWWLCK